MNNDDNLLLSINNYNYKSWGDFFENSTVDLSKLYIHDSWKPFFKKIKKESPWERLNKYLSHCLKVSENEVDIFPYPDLVFDALNVTPLNKIKVVIIGQDPYFNFEHINNPDSKIPQAMGLSFSVPVGVAIPSSLNNIYKNLIKFGHIDKYPNHGNLIFWAYQGCLMLNASLTVQHGHKNSHAKFWSKITDELINYISCNCDNIIFTLWGSFALSKLDLIDEKKHHVLISSHPSGLSNNKTIFSKKKNKTFQSFNDTDHFGEINNILRKNGKNEIIWRLY